MLLNGEFSENEKIAKIVHIVTSHKSHDFMTLVQSLF